MIIHKTILVKLKSFVRLSLAKIYSFFSSEISISKKLNYDLLGYGDDHYFVGYYDKDPTSFSGKHILCHKVSSSYKNMIEPSIADIGLLDIENNNFEKMTETNAMNWQLGSRVQWIDEHIILYNDIINEKQCSVKFCLKNKERLFVFQRPFWDVSHDKKLAASLNFSRIKTHRPGYGYKGSHVDGDNEILTIFDLSNDNLIYEIELDEILDKVNFVHKENEEIYMNHIVWSPCNKKLMTIFHYEDKLLQERKIFPILLDLQTKEVVLLHRDGWFSHHTFMDENRILAYLRINNEFCFAIWSNENGWQKIDGSMPSLDGHPSYATLSNSIIVDSYPNRFGVMSLYIGCDDNSRPLEKIAKITSPPQYTGPLRCDLHPRLSENHDFIVCDVPIKDKRRILIIKGALGVK